ncbi:serine/threonine-protein kinase [Leptodesmis sichuanensis]|uniref:serine/threonine-protein kinase n=1 Tax=Leptodesmis sichuanensis TaxID=2906798 RepID=UPI001F48114A|nr:serine/threonine-protein kinase [Leptodesmis sichuanensis]UIE39654.1 serine/threonine protein kinase [Leptodesmis sichuanensis A121]
MSTSLSTELYPSKYRLLGLVGQGQFGRVYCASHRKTGAIVALKELDRQRFSTQKFLRELRFLLLLQHPHIVTCRALEQTETSRYLVMDYCEAGTLRNLLDEEVRLHPMEGLNLLTQVLQGLEHAHQRGIVHCDIKPENILLTAIAEGWTARISDFGIARLSQELLNEEFSNTGSPAYMAPERFYGQYSPASDLYAIGIMLYELLVGRRPFSGAPAELMSAHLNQALQIPDTVPPGLKTVIATALQKLPARRFRSAAEMRECLQTAIVHAEPELSLGWTAPALLRPGQPPASVPFQCIESEPLKLQIQQLVGCDRGLLSNRTGMRPNNQDSPVIAEKPDLAVFRVADRRISYQTFVADASDLSLPHSLIAEESDRVEPAEPIASSPDPWPTVQLQEPVLDLVLRPQGCFAVTETAVYFLTLDLLTNQLQESEAAGSRQQAADQRIADGSLIPLPQLLIALPQKAQVAIDPAGKWIAAVASQTNHFGSQLNLWNFKPFLPFRPAIVRPIPPCFQILALDSRHIITFSHVSDGEACITGVRLEGFTRRGTALGSLQLPVPLQQICLTSTPYRLLALEPRYPKSVLVLDLKPLRIQRIGLDITPKYVVATTWGSLLMAADGEIALLNDYGQLIGSIHGPAHPTAIAALSPYEFAISTWHQNHGCLYRVDLRQLDLDVIF